jgi:hypothetical protein
MVKLHGLRLRATRTEFAAPNHDQAPISDRQCHFRPSLATRNPGISKSLSRSEIVPMFAPIWLWIIFFPKI